MQIATMHDANGYPLTGNQERYLFAQLLTDHVFITPIWYAIEGALDCERLKIAIAAAIDRHAAARSCFVKSPAGEYRCVVNAKPAFRFHHLKVERIDRETIARVAQPLLRADIDMSDAESLQRYVVLEGADQHWALAVAHHHALSDGVSMHVFMADVAAAYSGERLPPRPAFHDVPPPPGPAAADLQAAWSDMLGGMAEVPRFHRELAAEKTAATLDRFAPSPEGLAPAGAVEALRSAFPGASLFSVLAALYALQIARQTGLSDVVFSIQSAGRRHVPADVMGSFSNAVPVRVAVDWAEPVSSLVERTHRLIRRALTHETLPYHEIQRLTGVHPDFGLNLFPDAPPLQMQGLRVGRCQFMAMESDYSINLRWSQGEDGLSACVFFDQAGLGSGRAWTFLSRQMALVDTLASRPGSSAGDLIESITPGLESAPAGAKPMVDPVPPVRMHEAFLAEAARNPARTAVRTGSRQVSYGDLASRVRERAAAFARAGLAPGDRCALIGERELDLVVNMLGLSVLGAVPAVIDADYPEERILQLLACLGPRLVLLSDTFDRRRASAFEDEGHIVRSVKNLGAPDAPLPPAGAKPTEDIAYILFTSGTTGQPKMLGIGHGAIARFVSWQAQTFRIGAGDRVTMLSGLSHDPVMRDIFLPLSTGAELCIPPAKALRDPHLLADWLRRTEPTVIHTTPPAGRLMISALGGQPTMPKLRYIFWGGDLLGCDVTDVFRACNPGLVQVNFYGATETPQAVCYHVLDDTPYRTSPVGRAVPGVIATVRDSDNRELAVNEVGQIVVTTPYSVFVSDGTGGFRRQGADYETGDVGYRLPDGAIMLLGRKDDQVKVRGYRIELEEVARTLRRLPGVTAASVLARPNAQGLPELVAHVAPASLRPAALRSDLSKLLPDYMVPTHVVTHAALPQLPNGKIDRRALLAIVPTAAGPAEGARPPETEAEHRLAGLFTNILGRPVDNVAATPVGIGVDSLSSIQIQLRLETMMRAVPQDWLDQDLASLAAMVERDSAGPKPSRLAMLFSLSRVDLAAVYRALAIFFVVALHFHWFDIGGGGTALLFLLAGYSFYRFQLPDILETGSPMSIPRMMGHILALTIPVSFLIMGAQWMRDDDMTAATVLLGTNFLDFAGENKTEGGIIWLWFIHCYIQIYLIFFLILLSSRARGWLRERPFATLAAAFLIACVLRFAVPAIFNPDFLSEGAAHLTKWNYLPTTHMATILLGMAAAAAASQSHKIAVALVLVVYAAVVSIWFPHTSPLLFIVCGLSVMFIQNIPMPRVVVLGALAISSASLFIYLMHEPLHTIFDMSGLPLTPASLTLLVILVSLPLWKLWNIFYARLGQILGGSGRMMIWRRPFRAAVRS